MEKILILAVCAALIGGTCIASASPPERVTPQKEQVNIIEKATFDYTVVDCQEAMIMECNELAIVKPEAFKKVVCNSYTVDVAVSIAAVRKKIPVRKIEPPSSNTFNLFGYSMAH